MSGFKLTLRQRQRLEQQLHQTRDLDLFRRTMAILDFSRGEPAARIAERLGVTPRSVYYWIAAYNASPRPAALATASRSGRPPLWTEQTSQTLQALLESSPQDWNYPATDWTAPLLADALERLGGRRFSRNTIHWGVHRLGYVWKRPRYVLEPDPELEKKTSDSAAIAPAGIALRGAGPGRDRSAPVSAAARGLGAAR